MNNIYIYNNNFKSLIKLIYNLINKNIKPFNIKNNNYTCNLFETPIYLKLEDINYNISKRIITTCFKVYLSIDVNKEIYIYYFIKNYLKYGDNIYFHRHLNCVNKINKIEKNVSNENHKYKGFLRFKMHNNFLYATIFPTNNIIFLLTNHFKNRFKNEYWIIYDSKRSIYAFYDTKKVYYLTNKEIIKLNIKKQEDTIYEDLWKMYFNNISINERLNKKCQQNLMPKKYRKYIIEMENENEIHC